MKSFWFNTVKYGFDRGLSGYTIEGCKIFVKVGYITPIEYSEITDTAYN